MSDTYGSGLTFDVQGGGADAAPGLPQGPGSPQGPIAAAPDVEGPQPRRPQAPRDEQPTFGSSLRNMLPGAHYTPADPQLAPLDQAADLLQQRVKRASSIATNPWAQVFAPDQAAAAREFVPKAAEQLQAIEKQKAAIASGRVQARTLGLEPGEVSDQATLEDRVTVAQSKALKGNMQAFQGLQAVAPEKAAAIAPQVYETVAGHLSKAQLAFDSLASMQNEGQYQAKARQLRQDGTLTDLESLGMKLPPTLEAFNASKAKEGMALREARIAINAKGQELEARNTYQPMEEKEAKTYNGRLKTVYGDDVSAGPWSRNGSTGARGQVINGAADVHDLGKKYTLATPDQRKAIKEEFDGAMPKDEVEKYRAFNRTYELATKDAKGKDVPAGKINTNPNVQQGVAEGLASMLRGGQGGANVGLLRIELDKRGWSQSAIDGLVTNYAGFVNTAFKNADKPYLSEQTQRQIRDVMDVLKTYNDTSIGTRVTDIAKRAGALGLNGSAFGLGKDEVAGVIGTSIEEGRREQIERMKANHQAIGGGDGVIQLGAQRPGAQAAGLPPGTQPNTQIPGAQPLLTPVQQNGGAAPQPSPVAPPVNPGQPTNGGVQQPPASPLSPQPGGGGQPIERRDLPPVRIAGADVNVPLPSGASPTYVKATAHIESGNEKDPWKAGTKNSSASGAFQFIDSTWKDNKPAGAPERAKDATPQQQAEAFASLTAKNAASLKANNLPVTDTSLYIMHNLGAGGGASLLQAKPDADARSLVGEAAARNNPMFFKGRPTVATVLQRYGDAMAQGAAEDLDGPKPKPGAGGASLASTMARAAITSNPLGAAAAKLWDNLTPSQKDKVKDIAIDNAPAIGGTVGAIGGGATAGPLGGVAGGAAGATAGQALKDYLKGNEQSPRELAKQGVLGGVLGVASAARPIAATAARVIGSSAVEAGDEAVKGGSGPDVLEAGGKGALEAVGGEAFGRALGMAGHKVYSMFAPDARKAVQTAAKNYEQAAKTLETEQPKIVSPTGSVANPEYMAAEVAKAKAERVLKDAGLNPEEAAYAHRVSAEGVPKQEAQAGKPGALEEARVGAGYQQIEKEVADKGVGAVKATPRQIEGQFIARETGHDIGAEGLDALSRPGHFYRGMSEAEYQATLGSGKGLKSNLSASAPSAEGTNFSNSLADAESYANFGRTDPRKTGKPNYLIEVSGGPDMLPKRDGYFHSRDEIPPDRVTKVWKMENDSGAIVAKPVGGHGPSGGYSPVLTDGPMAAVSGKKVSAAHAETAERVEMAVTAPAKNWQEKWTQLKDARSDLLQAERDALGSTATGKTATARDMRTLADTVRAQQEKAAKYVFGEKEGEAVMQRLKTLDVRYRRLMEATHDGDLGAAARLKGEAGREADRRFRAFAHDDPAALAAWSAMRKHGPNVEKDVKDLVAAERIPVLGKVFSGIKLLGSFNQWMRDRAAGSPVKFSEVLDQMPDTSARTARNVAGTIVQHGAVQGDFGAMQ